MPSKPIKHLTAGAFIFTTERPRRTLLVHHRKGGVWLMPGGHVDDWENPYEATIREVFEETGLDISPYLPGPTEARDAIFLPLPKYFLEEPIKARPGEPAHFHLDCLYVVEMPHQPIKRNERESLGIGWFTWDEAKALPMYDNALTILEQEMTE